MRESLPPVEPVLEVVVLIERPTLDNVKVARAKDFIVLNIIPRVSFISDHMCVRRTFLWPELVDSLAFFCCAPLEHAGRLVRMSSEERDHLPVRRGKSPSQTPLPPKILKYGSTPPPLTLVLPLSQAPLQTLPLPARCTHFPILPLPYPTSPQLWPP